MFRRGMPHERVGRGSLRAAMVCVGGSRLRLAVLMRETGLLGHGWVRPGGTPDGLGSLGETHILGEA